MKPTINIKHNTANPCATNSLFKYIFKYKHNLGGTAGYPQVAYSQDFYSEQALFRKGLPTTLKSKWRDFVEDITFNNDVFSFFANVYPTIQEDNTTTLFYVGTDSMISIRRDISSNLELQNKIKEVCHRHQVFWNKIEEQSPYSVGIKCDLTPKYHPKVNQLNGMSACINYWKRHLTPRGLSEIQVFDNLMSTSDNKIATVIIEALN